MGKLNTTAVDGLEQGERYEMYFKLLAYAGPPPSNIDEYRGWSISVETGTGILHPAWDMVDLMDTTIRFRHWCGRMTKKIN